VRRLPFDLLENLSQLLSPRGVDRLHKSHTPFDTGSKIRMRCAVLARCPVADAICEDSFQAIDFGTLDVKAPIDNQAGKALPHALAHDAGLVMIHAEALLKKDGRRARTRIPVSWSLGCRILIVEESVR